MKRKKIIQNVIWILGSSALLFFYFLWLLHAGGNYRKHLRDEVLHKSDTLLLHAKFHAGDDPQWASPDFNDSSWETVRTDSLGPSYNGELAWFRIQFKTDSSIFNTPVALSAAQYGASEIYLNGLQIASFGKVAAEKDAEETMSPALPVPVQLKRNTLHTLAVRFSNYHFSGYKKIYDSAKLFPGFKLFLQDENSARNEVSTKYIGAIVICAFGMFLLTLSFVHLLLFVFYRKAKENLFYALFAFSYALFFILITIQKTSTNPSFEFFTDKAMEALIPLFFLSLLLFVLRVYKTHFPKWLWYCVIAACLVIVSDALNLANATLALGTIVGLTVLAVFTMALGTFRAIGEKIPGAKILGTGMGVFALFIFLIISMVFFSGSISVTNIWFGIGIVIAMLSIPLSMSIYLAYDFSHTNRSLSKKLIEVEDLSAKTIAQEKEKQEILSRQKENLEIQVTERTKEVVQQKKIIEEKNKDITDSINYAKRIQEAILPSDEQVKHLLPQSFVLFLPKDIVSGDFYFFEEIDGKIIAAAIDCTGHGVPGAFMSMVGYNHLKRIVSEQKITDTSKILNELHKQVLYSLNRDITKIDSKDGMDGAIVSIDKQKREVQFSGAIRPLYYFVNGNLAEVKGDRYSIAGVKEIEGQSYTSTIISVTEPATFYLSSDGFADQFGGKEGKKLMSRHFRELLTFIQGKSMHDQKKYLGAFMEEWRAGKEQMDDIMIIGIKVE